MEVKPQAQGEQFLSSQVVRAAWESMPNYLIETTGQQKELCVIYFSSNAIYYPNDEATFRERIVSRNTFEWYKNRIAKADRHIFVRDVFKQWYVEGINREVPDHDMLLAFLQQATQGYRRVVTVGSSAGGYAAILFGSLLKAERVFAFCPQITIAPLVENASPAKNPILFTLRGTSQLKYADLSKDIDMDSPNVTYFYSMHSKIDAPHYALLQCFRRLRVIRFDSDVHGVQCPVACLNRLLDYDDSQWDALHSKVYTPRRFALEVLGLWTFLRLICHKLRSKFF